MHCNEDSHPVALGSADVHALDLLASDSICGNFEIIAVTWEGGLVPDAKWKLTVPLYCDHHGGF